MTNRNAYPAAKKRYRLDKQSWLRAAYPAYVSM